MKWTFLVAGVLGGVGLVICMCVRGCNKTKPATEKEKQVETRKDARQTPDLTRPVRPALRNFARSSSMPLGKESLNSGAIDLATFHPVNDLIHFDDPRVWFESDKLEINKNDKEDNDHLIHRAMEWPLRRLANLVATKGGVLKIHDTYRSARVNRIHTERSLHCEGRAIDMTSEKIGLAELANLTWQAGFDYVLYEAARRSGEHIHASVKRDHADLPIEQTDPQAKKE